MRVRLVMNRSVLLVIGALLVAIAPGCATNDARTGTVDSKADSDIEVRQSVSEEILQEDAGEIRARQRAPEPEPQPSNAPLSIRDDGRPSWWFSGRRESGSEIAVCAEALGPDMRLTREAAIDAGRNRLRAGLDLPPGEPLPDVQVMRAWVWPLPNAQAGSNRYAGYVLMSAPLHQ